jgi:ankyrin repeat protein
VAVLRGNITATALLLQYGADANATDGNGNTPLSLLSFLVARADDIPIADDDSDDGSDDDSDDGEGVAELAEVLLRHGAAANACDENGTPIVIRVQEAAQVEALEQVLVKYNPDLCSVRAADGDTALGYYMFNSDARPSRFQRLADQGLDPFAADRNGMAPFHNALFYGQGFSTFILNSNLDWDRLGPVPWDFLLRRSIQGLTAKMLLLLRIRLSRSSPHNLQRILNTEPQGAARSPLCIFASSAKSNDLFDELLACGADIDFEGCYEGSPLMAACAGGHLCTVKHLLRRGAEFSYVGVRGLRSAVDAAKDSPHVLRWLLVGRFTERSLLKDAPSCTQATTVHPWSGIAQQRLHPQGSGRRAPNESLEEFLVRVVALKKEMRGRVLPPQVRREGEREAEDFAPLETVRVCPGYYGMPENEDDEWEDEDDKD